MVVLGDVVPDFKAESTKGPISFHEHCDGKWTMLFRSARGALGKALLSWSGVQERLRGSAMAAAASNQSGDVGRRRQHAPPTDARRLPHLSRSHPSDFTPVCTSELGAAASELAGGERVDGCERIADRLQPTAAPCPALADRLQPTATPCPPLLTPSRKNRAAGGVPEAGRAAHRALLQRPGQSQAV